MDYVEYDSSTVPLVNNNIYQENISTAQFNAAFDVLNYILEQQFFEFFTSNIYNIYFGMEWRKLMYGYPGLSLSDLPSDYSIHTRPWYTSTRSFHLASSDNKVYRVISAPYYDTGLKKKVITVSKSMIAPNILDTSKRYLTGKGRFIGVANVDIILSTFQKIFKELIFYETGFFTIADFDGNIINDPINFKQMVGITNDSLTLNINMLISSSDWKSIREEISKEYLISQITTLQGIQVVIVSKVSFENYYPQQSMTNMIIVPLDEIYSGIKSQKDNGFKNLVMSSCISLAIFLLCTYLCQIKVRRQIVTMVSGITQLNQNAVQLAENNIETPGEMKANMVENNNFQDVLATFEQQEPKNTRKEVMNNLEAIQKNTQSKTVKQLVKGFQNQLKGISTMGNGEQNVLKNTSNGLQFDKAAHSNTRIKDYVQPLIDYALDKPDNSYQFEFINDAARIAFRYVNRGEENFVNGDSDSIPFNKQKEQKNDANLTNSEINSQQNREVKNSEIPEDRVPLTGFSDQEQNSQQQYIQYLDSVCHKIKLQNYNYSSEIEEANLRLINSTLNNNSYQSNMMDIQKYTKQPLPNNLIFNSSSSSSHKQLNSQISDLNPIISSDQLIMEESYHIPKVKVSLPKFQNVFRQQSTESTTLS